MGARKSTDPGAFMTVPDRFPREADVPAGEESTLPVSETAVASHAIAVTPADPALSLRTRRGGSRRFSARLLE